MERMSLTMLIEALVKLRDERPHLADMEVYSEDQELGLPYGNSVVGVSSDENGVNLHISLK